MSRSVSVARLAKEAQRDLDDVLITLWYAGFNDLKSHNDIIRSNRLSDARAALGLHNPRRQISVDYWLSELQISRTDFTDLLKDMNINLSKDVRRLPKGALKKLRRLFITQNQIGNSSETPSVSYQQAQGSSMSKEAPSAKPEKSRTPCPLFRWRIVGTESNIQYLSEDEVLSVHEALVRDFATYHDPIRPSGVRDTNLLSSAVARPRVGYHNQLKYPTIQMAGAALLHSLVLNHAFFNGNKRTGLVCLLVFLDKNSFMPTCSKDDLFEITLRTAQHRLIHCNDCDSPADQEVQELATWVRKNSRRINKETNPIPWLKLKRLLRDFDCELEYAGVGNRINIARTVTKRSILGRTRQRRLSTQVQYGGDGSEVAVNTVHKIRSELELDERNGVDSSVFYGGDAEPDYFIQTYRMLLRRLARL